MTSITTDGNSLTIGGTNFGTDINGVSVTLYPSASRKKRSIELEDNSEYIYNLERKEKIKKRKTRSLNKHNAMYIEDSQEPKSTHVPLVDEDLFDDMEKLTDFWGKFTKTGAKSFAESVRMGAWKVAGRKLKKLYAEPKEIVRKVREATQASYECTPTSVTATEIMCTSDDLPSGSYDVAVEKSGSGLAAISGGASSITTSPTISSISPTMGSVNGGALLIITGTGFVLDSTTVSLDSNDCVIENESTTELKCRVPAHSAGTVTVEVNAGGSTINSPVDFEYASAKTPSVTSIK